MINVSIDFDMGQISTDDLIAELKYRNKGTEDIPGIIKTNGLNDKMKYEHITKVFNKYSLQQIEAALPE